MAKKRNKWKKSRVTIHISTPAVSEPHPSAGNQMHKLSSFDVLDLLAKIDHILLTVLHHLQLVCVA